MMKLQAIVRGTLAALLLVLVALKLSALERTLADWRAIVVGALELVLGSLLLVRSSPKWVPLGCCALGLVLAAVTLATPPSSSETPCSCFGAVKVSYAWRLVASGAILGLSALHLALGQSRVAKEAAPS